MNKTVNFQALKFRSKIDDILTHFIFYSSIIGINGLIFFNILNIIICCRKRIRK
jgi:hypothetical protein